MASDKVRYEDLLDIPDPRVPICLCLDTSGSMDSVTGGTPTGRTIVRDGKVYTVVTGGGKSRLQIMQEGLDEFYKVVYEDEIARYAAEICTVTFDDEARKLVDFSRVEYNNVQEKPPRLTTKNNTSMGEGLNLALKLLEARKKQYSENGVEYFQPWLVVITDGENNGSEAALNEAKATIRRMVEENKLSVYPFYVGEDSGKGMNTLAEISPKQKPLKIGANQMKGMFEWLGKSVSEMSKSDITIGNIYSLDEYQVSAWTNSLD